MDFKPQASLLGDKINFKVKELIELNQNYDKIIHQHNNYCLERCFLQLNMREMFILNMG